MTAREHFTCFAVFVTAVFLAASVPAQEKHKSEAEVGVHQYLAGEAWQLLIYNSALPPEMVSEFAQHIGPKIVDWCFWEDECNRFSVIYGGKEVNQQPADKPTRCSSSGPEFAVPYDTYTSQDWHDHKNGPETCGTGGNDIIEGSHEEDQYDPLALDYFDTIFPGDWDFFNGHFWNPDNYDDGRFGSCLDSEEGGGLSAPLKGELYWNRALSAYAQGNRDDAYYYLGRIVHLLTDMGATAHVHNDPHPPGNDDNFEEYFGEKQIDWDSDINTGEVLTCSNAGNDNNYVRWGWNKNSSASLALSPVNPNALSVEVENEWYGSRFQHRTGDDSSWPDWAYGHAEANRAVAVGELYKRTPLFRLFYSLAETTDDFPSDDDNGDDPQYDSDNNFGDVSYTKVVEYADTIIPATIEHIAGLYELFWDEVHSPEGSDYMLVLLDRTGSMVMTRPATGNTRCADALTLVEQDIRTFFAAGGVRAALWTFAGSTYQDLTGGFVDEAQALAALATQSPTGCTGSTPMADAICAAAQELSSAFAFAGYGERILAISSDGGENNSTGPCSGPSSNTSAPYEVGSWQYNTRRTILAQNAILARYWGSVARGGEVDPETGEPFPRSTSDWSFFSEVATVGGGGADEVGDDDELPEPFFAHLFSDGFESGSSCEWSQGGCDEPEVFFALNRDVGIQRVLSDGSWGTLVPVTGRPYSLAVRGGEIFVSSQTKGGDILVYDLDGAYLRTVPTPAVAADYLVFFALPAGGFALADNVGDTFFFVDGSGVLITSVDLPPSPDSWQGITCEVVGENLDCIDSDSGFYRFDLATYAITFVRDDVHTAGGLGYESGLYVSGHFNSIYTFTETGPLQYVGQVEANVTGIVVEGGIAHFVTNFGGNLWRLDLGSGELTLVASGLGYLVELEQ